MQTSRTRDGVQQSQTKYAGVELQGNGSSKKRKLDDDSQSLKMVYFKLRAIVRDLRPHFIEVLQTPEFRNCKAVPHIQKQMKTMLELSKLLGMGAVSNEHQTMNPEIPSKEEAAPIIEEEEEEEEEEEKAPMKKEAEGNKAEKAVKPLYGERHIKGSYIIGGSPPQENFIVYHSTSDPVFYGVTKEAWLAKLLQKSESRRSISK